MKHLAKTTLGMGLLLLLAACSEPSAEQVAHVKAVLPPGCVVTDVGRYGRVDDLVVVHCPAQSSDTTRYSISHGKTRSHIESVLLTDALPPDL